MVRKDQWNNPLIGSPLIRSLLSRNIPVFFFLRRLPSGHGGFGDTFSHDQDAGTWGQGGHPMLQICPAWIPTTIFDPQIFFFYMFDSSRNERHQIPSWFVGGYTATFSNQDFLFEKMNNEHTKQITNQYSVGLHLVWVLIGHCGPLGHLVGEIEEAFSKTPKKNQGKLWKPSEIRVQCT